MHASQHTYSCSKCLVHLMHFMHFASYRHEMAVLAGHPVLEGDAIKTTTNTVYEMMKQLGQEGRLEHDYELISPPGGPPPAVDEIPLPPTSHQPLPAIPLPVHVGCRGRGSV